MRYLLFLLRGSQVMQVCITQDAEKPRFRSFLLAQLMQLVLRQAKSFLGQVLGELGRTAEPIGVAIQGRVMGVH